MSRVSYVMMHDPGGARAHRPRSAPALDELVGELVAAAGVERDRVVDDRARRQPDHAPPRARHRSDAARHRAVHARDRRAGRRVGRRRRARRCRTRRCYACRASPATSAPTPSAAIAQEGPHRGDGDAAARRRRHQRGDRAGQPRPPVRGVEPDRARVRGRADLSCGQRATAGAIERVRIDPETLEPRVKVIGIEPWSDEPGFAAGRDGRRHRRVRLGRSSRSIAELFARRRHRRATAPSTAPPADALARVVPDDRTFALRAARGAAARELRITQNDVRAIQLAKAALNAGVELLMDHAGRSGVRPRAPRRRVRQPHRPA